MDLTKKNALLLSIAEIGTCDDADQVVDVFSRLVETYGFESFAVAQFANPAKIPLKNRIAIATWPSEYTESRGTERDEIHDPIISYAIKSRRPFTWAEAREHASRNGRRMIEAAGEFGLSEGLVFPIHSTDSLPGGVSLATRHLEVSPDEISELYLAAIHCFLRLEQLLGPFPFAIQVDLTPREKDVLHWAAAGKTNWEISRILSLSERTIEHYMTSARRKLGAVNAVHAVSNALTQQLILP